MCTLIAIGDLVKLVGWYIIVMMRRYLCMRELGFLSDESILVQIEIMLVLTLYYCFWDLLITTRIRSTVHE
jgi:hypothetical protein